MQVVEGVKSPLVACSSLNRLKLAHKRNNSSVLTNCSKVLDKVDYFSGMMSRVFELMPSNNFFFLCVLI